MHGLILYLIILIFFISYKFGFKISFFIALILSVNVFIFGIDKNLAGLLIALFLATPAVFLIFDNFAKRYIDEIQTELDRAESKFNKLKLEEAELLKAKASIEKDFDEIESYYEITKEFSLKLNEESAIAIFKKYLRDLGVCDDAAFAYAQDDLKSFDEKISVDFEQQNLGFVGINGLKDRNRFSIIFLQFSLALRRARSYSQIQELAVTDDLTRLFLRRHVLERFHEEFIRSVKNKLKLSFIMIDIDDFKNYNDKFGHLVGDVILNQVAEILKQNIREIDLAGRYGGEEFVLILPETDKQGGILVAERIRQDVQRRRFKAYDEALSLTISLGVATYPEDAARPQELIDCADQSLYKAKRKGKNLTIAD